VTLAFMVWGDREVLYVDNTKAHWDFTKSFCASVANKQLPVLCFHYKKTKRKARLV
jgi:hypothetical protein